ncbi:uncharacterized protein LOC120336395 [Styela clava]
MASLYYSPQTYAMNSQSRIPTRINNTNAGNSPANRHHNGGFTQIQKEKTDSINNLSPLQKLQKDYQEKLQLEKERKMTSIYDKWREDALKRVEMHSGNRNKRPSKESTSRILSTNERQHEKSSGYSAAYQRRITNSAQNKQYPQKPHKLPPINNTRKARSFHTEREGQTSGTPPVKIRSVGPATEQVHHMQNGNNMQATIDEGHASPPPNVQHLRLLRERKLKQRKLIKLEEKRPNLQDSPGFPTEKTTKRKLTDFEKWQQQQDAERMARLEKHQRHQQPVIGSAGEFDSSESHFNKSNKLNAKPPLQFAARKHKTTNRGFDTNGVHTKRSISPVIQKQKNKQSGRQEPLRQGFQNDNERKIAELERQMRQKQLDLARMREVDKRTRLDSGGYGTSGSENDSENELLFLTSNAPSSKPMKVPLRRFRPSNHNVLSGDEEDDKSDVGFQMKPVLVRRDASSGSSRGTPKKDKTHATPMHQVKHSQRNKLSPDLKMKQEREPVSRPPISPPLITTKKSPRNTVATYSQRQPDEENVAIHTVPCKICGRKFADDRLAKHLNVCKKSKNKKRKVFDMTKARTQGTEIEKYAIQNVVTKARTPPVKKSNWRSKHEDFVRTVREAKKAQIHLANGGSLSDLTPPPPMENPDYVHCQYCDRKFDPYVAQRHIPRCKDIKSRPKPPKRRGV